MKKINIMLMLVTLLTLVVSTVVDAKSFGGRSSSFSSSRSSGSSFSFGGGSKSSSSFSFGGGSKSSSSSNSYMFGGSNKSKAIGTGAAIGAYSSSSSSDSKSSSIKIQRDNVLGSLSSKGAKGSDAGVLYKSFQSRNEPLKKFDQKEITRMFEPSYRTSRRSDYYNGYHPKYSDNYDRIVHVHHDSGYGIWDYMLFNSILDNVGDRQMYYHHQSDPAFQQWRTDANSACAAGDKDVCEKLADLDKEMAQYKAKGIQPNANYITPGIDPDIYEANNIDPKTLPELKICTGSLGSDFNRFASEIGSLTKMKVKSIQSNGSADNLGKLATGVCDLGFVQNDLLVTSNLQKVISPNQIEVGFLVCSIASNVKTMKDLSNDITVHIGSDQTGSVFTFGRLKNVVEGLDKVKVDTSKPIMQAIGNIKDSDKDCVFAVTTPKSPVFKELDASGKFHGVPMYSWDFSDTKPTYTLVTIDKGYYTNLTQKDNQGWGTSNGTDSIGVGTSLVAPQSWIDQNKQMFDLLMLERNKLQSAIK